MVLSGSVIAEGFECLLMVTCLSEEVQACGLKNLGKYGGTVVCRGI